MHHALKIVVATGANAAAPAQFLASYWSVADDGTSGDITITISTLPSDGGSALTDLEYQLDGGAWVSMAGTTTGDYPVTGLTDNQEYDVAIRAVNAVGNGTASATKAVIPSTIEFFGDVALLLQFQEADGATTGADDSNNNFDWTRVGNATVASNYLTLDGSGDYLTLASAAADWNFLHDGSTWTIEFTVNGRPTTASNTVLDTTAASSNNRGIFVGITSAGVLRVIISRAVPAAAQLDYTSPLTVPNDASDHHIVIEWDWGDGSSQVDAIRVGMDGTREDTGNRNANAYSVANASNDLMIGRANSATTLDYNGELTGIRIHRDRLVYGLKDNATYSVPSYPYPTSGTNNLKQFAARFFPKEEIAGSGRTWDTYMTEPRIVAGAVAGTYYCFLMCGSSHDSNVTMEIIRFTSTDYGRTWGSVTTIATDATYACRNLSVGKDSNGVIIVCYRKADSSNVHQGTFYRTSADNFATETQITSSLNGTVPFGRAVETSDGLLFTFYKEDFAEALYWNAGTTSFGTAVEIYDVTGTTPGYNEPFAISDGADNVVWVARRDGAGNNDYAFYKSTDAGATTSFLEEIQWTATTFDFPAPAALAVIDGSVVCVWNSRATDYKLKYTKVASAADFWSDPGRVMDGTETINTLRQMRANGLGVGIDGKHYGYADIVDLGGRIALISNYEQVLGSSTTLTRLWAQTLAI